MEGHKPLFCEAGKFRRRKPRRKPTLTRPASGTGAISALVE